MKVKRAFSLGGEEKAEDLKGFGYGVPYVIEFSVDGEPADDVSAMTINYIFYSLQAFGRMDDPFERLLLLFWRNYLDRTGDDEILSVVQPFYAWRSLVLASPLWYPNLSVDVRKKILRFARKVLKAKKFDYDYVESYLE